MAIRLFQTDTSMFCEKIRTVLRLKKVPYEVVDVRNDRTELIRFSGQKKFPVLDFHGQPIIDSTSIAAFLEEKYPQNSIYPQSASDRGLCLLLEDWADEVLNQAVRALRRAETEEARREAAKGLEIHFRVLDQFFGGKTFIFGRMTIADIAIFAQLHYLYTVVKYEIPAEHRNLRGWMETMRESLGLKSLYDIAA